MPSWSAAAPPVPRPRPSSPAAAARVLLLDRAGRIKPCGGAIPPRADPRLRDPGSPPRRPGHRCPHGLAQGPPGRHADRGRLRRHGRPRACSTSGCASRAAAAGAERLSRHLRAPGPRPRRHRRRPLPPRATGGAGRPVRARTVIGADGAISAVARQAVPGAERMRYVFAYHEIVRSPPAGAGRLRRRPLRRIYQGALSPDFYAWVFPHGDTASIGTGSAHKGFSLARRRRRPCAPATGLDASETIRREGAPIPLTPAQALGQWPRRGAGRRRRRRGRARLGRGHLLRHGGRPARRRGGRRVPRHRRRPGAGHGTARAS